MSYALKHFLKTAAEFTSENPILIQGQYGEESDTGFVKIGDGITEWINLSYFPQTSVTNIDGGTA